MNNMTPDKNSIRKLAEDVWDELEVSECDCHRNPIEVIESALLSVTQPLPVSREEMGKLWYLTNGGLEQNWPIMKDDYREMCMTKVETFARSLAVKEEGVCEWGRWIATMYYRPACEPKRGVLRDGFKFCPFCAKKIKEVV